MEQGFLESLYQRKIDNDSMHLLDKNPINPEAIRIAEKFLEVMKQFNPIELEKQKRVPEALWDTMKSMGLFGLTIPVEYGGKGLLLRDYLYIIEVLAGKDMSLALIPLAHLSIGLKGLLLFGTDDQKNRYLPNAATGKWIFAYALTEPKIGSDARHIEATAELSHDKKHYVINGHKTYITNGGYAKALTVFAQLDSSQSGNMGAFIIETDWPGVKIGKDMEKMGLSVSSTTPVTLENVKVPVENLLGSPGQGFKIAMTVLNYGRLGLGAASHGLLEQSIEDMINRSMKRKQFNVPISTFELIQEKIVQAQVRSTSILAITSFTASILEKNPLAEVPIESSHCKLFGTTQAWNTLYDAQQVSGGAGYLKTLPYEKRLRDFRATLLFEGTTEIHSMYPALMVIRQIVKNMQKKGLGKIHQIIFLIKGAFSPGAISLPFPHPVVKKANRVMNTNLKLIMRMAYLGLLIYGKNIAQKEFYLRRITRLSISLFTLFSVSMQLGTAKSRRNDLAQNTKVLEYMIEEATKIQKENNTIFPKRKELIFKAIFENIIMKEKNTQ